MTVGGTLPCPSCDISMNRTLTRFPWSSPSMILMTIMQTPVNDKLHEYQIDAQYSCHQFDFQPSHGKIKRLTIIRAYREMVDTGHIRAGPGFQIPFLVLLYHVLASDGTCATRLPDCNLSTGRNGIHLAVIHSSLQRPALVFVLLPRYSGSDCRLEQ